jgi:hypothetical protein
MNTENYGTIINKDGYVQFYFIKDDVVYQGSEPLKGNPIQTREDAINKILDIFKNNNIVSHEIVDERTKK